MLVRAVCADRGPLGHGRGEIRDRSNGCIVDVEKAGGASAGVQCVGLEFLLGLVDQRVSPVVFAFWLAVWLVMIAPRHIPEAARSVPPRVTRPEKSRSGRCFPARPGGETPVVISELPVASDGIGIVPIPAVIGPVVILVLGFLLTQRSTSCATKPKW